MTLHSFINALLFNGKKDETGETNYPLPMNKRVILVQKLLKEMNCIYESAKTDIGVSFSFLYQGSYFILRVVDSPCDQLVLPDIVDASFEELSDLQEICNYCNGDPNMGRLATKYCKETHSVTVSILTGLTFLGTFDTMQEYLEQALQNTFSLREIFCSFYDKHVDGEEEGAFTRRCEKVRGLMREHYLLREQELAETPASICLPRGQEEAATIGAFINRFYDGGQWLPYSLLVEQDVDNEQKTTLLDKADDILHYNLFTAMVKGQGKDAAFAAGHAVLTFTFNDVLKEEHPGKRRLFIILEQNGETEHTLYVRLTAILPPVGLVAHTSVLNPQNLQKSYSFLLAYDKTTERQHEAEFNYMLKDVQDKMRHGKKDELTPEQKFIYDCEINAYMSRLYWGRKYFLQKRYYQAVFYLEDAFNCMRTEYADMTDGMASRFFNICYMLGFSYCELHLYQKAYYYLDIVVPQENMNYVKAYVNCLVKSQDFRALDIIDNLLERLDTASATGILSDNGEDEETQSFCRYLLQRKVSVLINEGDLDEAEKLCKELLEDDESRKYATREMARIHKLLEDLAKMQDDEKK